MGGKCWHVYDRLIENIAPKAAAGDCLVGLTWTLVDADGLGVAMTYRGGMLENGLPQSISGRSLRELGMYVKSWNLGEASLGMAAVNAFYNTRSRVEAWTGRPLEELRAEGAFSALAHEVAGKKVAVIGHFPGLEELATSCELSILERNPLEGDLPDFAAEYVLPEQDYIFITGTALTNKTMPRLLELCAQATVALVGPTVPLVPWWFDLGVDILAGAVVTDKAAVWRCTQEGGHRGIFERGAWTVQVRKGDLRPDA